MKCDESRVTWNVGIAIFYVDGPIRWRSREMPLEDLGFVYFRHGLTRVHVHVCVIADMNSRGGMCY